MAARRVSSNCACHAADLQPLFAHWFERLLRSTYAALTLAVARNRLKTEGVPAGDIVLKVLKEIGPIPSTMEPELEASFLGPVILGNFRESFAHYIRNGETLICVQASTDDRVELAVDTLKQYAPIEVKVVPAGENPAG